MSSPTVLIIYPGSILALGGGQERALGMCKALKAAGIKLCLVSRDQDTIAVDSLNLFNDVRPFKPQPGIRLKHHEKSFLARNIDIEFDDFARRVAMEIKPTAVITNFAWTAGTLADLPKAILGILDTHDIQHVRKLEAELYGVTNFDRHTSKTEELRMLRKADLLVAIQCEEASMLKSLLPSKEVVCAGHSMDPKPLSSHVDSKSVFFVGSNYPPNIIGAKKFIETAWPAIIEKYPDATLDICGAVCSNLGLFSGIPGVRLHGQVDDLSSFYAKAAVVINVALFGTGLPIKTAEAISYGKCLVCTPSNARGFDRKTFPGSICEFHGLAKRICHLLEDISERSRMESASMKFAREEMNPQKVYGELIAQIRTHDKQSKSCNTVMYKTPGLIFHLLLYSFSLVFNFYAGRVLSSLLYTVQPQKSPQKSPNSELLFAYIKLQWRMLSLNCGIKKVAIFGAGQHTTWMEWVLSKTIGPEIMAIADDKPADKAPLFGLKPIQANKFDPRKVDAIILSSDCFQAQMAKRCRELYGEDVKLIDLYEGLPPGPYEKR